MDTIILKEDEIKNKIYTIRGLQVMIDADLAKLYNVETKVLNQAVKRNGARFPMDFMFQLSNEEKNELVTNCDHLQNLKFASTNPYVFTQEGVATLSGVLNSKKAIEINIFLMRAFVAMRKFIASNASVFFRLDNVERKQLEYDKNFEKVFSAIEDKTLTKKQGIFFDGQIFDAYSFVSDLIRSAEKSVILIDNYIDDSVLTLFNKRNENVSVVIYTANLSKELKLDLEKYNSQYAPVEIKEFKQSHDRFLIIDDSVYSFSASLKDLGKKWFAFCKMDKEGLRVVEKIK